MANQIKKSENSILDDFEDIEGEIMKDKVSEVIRDNPNNPMEALEDIGFTWYDDDYPSEEDEENSAVADNQNQEILVKFLRGDEEPSAAILETFLAEKASDNPNLPLFRKYFGETNQNLKALILWSLEHYPERIDLLQDLGFFHDFSNILSAVIEYYTRACESQEDMGTFY